MATEHIVPLYRLELIREKNIAYRKTSTTDEVAQVFHEMLDSAHIEKMAAIHVNSSREMIGAEIVAIGQMESVQCCVSDLFKGAIRNNASAIWIAHNHVDGFVKPSLPDYSFTLAAADAAIVLQIPLIDHLVIGHNNHYSIKENQIELGLMFENAAMDMQMKMLMSVPPKKRFPF